MAAISRSMNVGGFGGDASTGPQFEAGRRFWACARPASRWSAAYRAMPLEAQAECPLTLSPHSDPLLGFPGPIRRVGEQERLEAVFTIRMRFLACLHGADERVEFVAIGDLIALEEKVERLVAREPVRTGKLDRRLAHVRGMNHAVHAMRFDPLIIAIRCAPRIGDLRDLAGRGLHDDDRGIDIANVANRLVDQR